MTYKVEFLGNGSYNAAYKISENGRVLGVLKIQLPDHPNQNNAAAQESIDIGKNLDTIQRSIRIWHEINPTLEPAKEFSIIMNGVMKTGWLCPYIEGEQANDNQIKDTLIDIYKRTGRIILDGVGKKNIVTDKNGKTVCIDIGLAARLDNEYGPLPRIKNTKYHHERRGSIAGVAHWRELQNDYTSYFKELGDINKFPQSVNVIKALIFLNRHMPDLSEVSFLDRSATTQIIAAAYDKELTNPEQSSDSVNKALNIINAILVLRHYKPALLENESFLLKPEVAEIIANAHNKVVARVNVSSDNADNATLLQSIDKALDAEYLKYVTESKKYLQYLQSKPKNILLRDKISIMTKAISILESDSDLQTIKAEFTAHLNQNATLLTKRADTGLKQFIKGIGVAAATVLGLLIGGVLAYTHLFGEKRTKGAQFLKQLNLKESPKKIEEQRFSDQKKLKQSLIQLKKNEHDDAQERITQVITPSKK